jgi:cyclophilin family peptidyl-prolyl cis-trans isomerase
VPTDKRARQRAGRQARLAVIARRQQRRRRLRASAIVVVIAAIVVGSVYLITRKSTTTLPNTAQGRLEAVWQKADCPTSIKTRVNTLSYKAAPAVSVSGSAIYTASVKTDVGTFVMALNQKESPLAVNSFVYLAKKGYFNCDLFHRVIPTFVDQTGDPTGTGTGGPGYEFTEAGPPVASPQYPLGSVAMANSDNPATTTPKTNGSQWFVVTGSQGEALPPDYVLFGQVSSGLSVVQKINRDGSTAGAPKLYHRILSVTIKEA